MKRAHEQQPHCAKCQRGTVRVRSKSSDRVLNLITFGLLQRQRHQCPSCGETSITSALSSPETRISLPLPKPGAGQFHTPYFIRLLEKKADA